MWNILQLLKFLKKQQCYENKNVWGTGQDQSNIKKLEIKYKCMGLDWIPDQKESYRYKLIFFGTI